MPNIIEQNEEAKRRAAELERKRREAAQAAQTVTTQTVQPSQQTQTVTTPKPVQTTQTIQTSQPAQEQTQTVQMPQQTARQQLMATQKEPEKWYKGDTPTSYEIIGRIVSIGQTDKKKGAKLWEAYQNLASDRTSPLYNPYGGATNQAVYQLQALGYKMPKGATKEWIEKNKGLLKYARTGTGGTPLAPSKKSTKEQNAAYWYYKLVQAEQNTQQAETEWNALKEEVLYWTQRKDRNYSDDEILNKIDWSKYKTLTAMDEAKSKGTPLQFNRSIGYDKGLLPGLIWAVRNNATSGGLDVWAIKAAMGEGKGYEANQVTQDMLDPTSGNYNPYAAWNTVDEASLHFGMNWFNQDWLDQNKGLLTTGSDEDKRLYNQVYQAEKTTKKAEEEWRQLQREIGYWAARADKDLSKDEIMNMIDWKKYKTLTAMDESLESGQIMQMTRGVGYSRQAVSQLLESLRPNNTWKEDPEITARLDPTSDKYNPYAVSATLDDAALYFGVSGFDKDWLEKNRGLLASNNETDKEYYQKVYQAEQTTLKAEQEYAQMAETINTLFKTTSNADLIIAALEDDSDYSTLWKMGESLQSGKLMMTTRPIKFKWEDVKQAIRDMCDEYNAERPNAAYVHDLSKTLGSTTMVSGFKGQLGANIDDQMKAKEEPEGTPEKPVTKAGDMPKPSATKPPSPLNSPTQAAITQGKDNNIEAAAPTISASGTAEDKIVWETAYSSDYETCVQQITSALDNGTMGGQEAYDYTLGRANTYAAENYMDVLAKKHPYEKHMEQLAQYQMQKEILAAQIEAMEAALPGGEEAAMWRKFPQMVIDFRNTNGNMEGYTEEEMNFFASHINDMANAIGNIDEDDAIASWVADQLGPEYQELDKLNVQMKALETNIGDEQNRVNAAKADYDEAVEQEKLIQSGYDQAARLAAINGSDTERAYDLMAVMQYAYGVGGEYNPTQWNAYNAYDLAIQEGASYDEVFAAAKQGQAEYQQEIKRLQYVKDQLTQNGVKVDQSVIDNLDREIARLERESQAADYFLDQNTPGFVKDVKNEKAKIRAAWEKEGHFDVENEGYDYLDYLMVNPSDDPGGDIGGWSPSVSPAKLTDRERNTYLYIRATEGRDAAHDYYNYLTDDTYGIVTTRVSEESRAQLEQFSKEHAAAGMALSIIASPLQMAGGLYSFMNGGEINPHSGWFAWNTAVTTLRSTSEQQMIEDLGLEEGSFGHGLFKIGYGALTSGTESMINSFLIGGPLGNMVGFGLTEAEVAAKSFATIAKTSANAFISSIPMGIQAAGTAVQQAKMNGATDDQAVLIGGITFLCETATEAITTQNITEAFARGQEAGGVKAAIRKMFKNDLVEEAVGESLNEILEGVADDQIMGAYSNRNQAIEKYIDAGMSREEAEKKANSDFWQEVFIAGATGALSAGGHAVIASSLGKVTGAMNKSRVERNIERYVDSHIQQTLDNAIARQEGTQATQQANLEALQGQVNAYADRVNEVGDQAVGLATQAREAQQAAQAEQDQNVQWDQNDTLTPAQRQEKSKRIAQANFSLKQRRNNDGSYYTATLDAEGNIVADRQVFPDGHEEQLYTPGQTENKIILEPAPQRQVAPKEMRKADATERTATEQTAPQETAEPAPHPDQQVNPRAMVVQDATTRTATEQVTPEAPQEQPAPHPDQQVNPREMRLNDATTLTPQETAEQNTTEQNTAEQTTEQQNTAEPAQHPGQQVAPREMKVDNATERTGTPAQTQEAPPTAPEAPQRVRQIKAGKVISRLNREIVALSEATETKNDVSKTSTVAAVLNEVASPTVSSAAAQHMVAKMGGDKAMTTIKDILMTSFEMFGEAGRYTQQQVKRAITIATLGNGMSTQVLNAIAEEGATGHINELMQMAEVDEKTPDVMQRVEQADYENQTSQQMRTDAGDGSMNAIKPYEQAEAKTRKREMKARKALDKATQAVIAKGAAVSSLYQQMMADPTNAELRGQWQQAMNDLVGAKRVQEEYQQSYENASEDHTKAAQDLQDIRNRTMTEARQQAAETVDARIAQQQEEQRLAEEQKAKEEAEKAEAKEREQATNNIATLNANDFIDRVFGDNITEEERQYVTKKFQDAQRRMAQQFREAQSEVAAEKQKNRDTFVSQISKKFGVGISFADTSINGQPGPRGYYDRANNRIVLDTNTTAGDAMYFVAGHELTHVAEQSGTYDDIATALLKIRFGDVGNFQEFIQGVENGTIKNQAAMEILGKQYYYNARLAQMHEQDASIDSTPLSVENAAQEVVADIMGQVLQGDQNLINQLCAEEPSTARKILNSIKSFLKKLVGIEGPWKSDTQRVVDMLENALKETQAQRVGTQEDTAINGRNVENARVAKPVVQDRSGDAVVSELPGNTEVKNNLASWTEEEQQTVKRKLIEKGFADTDVQRWIDDTNGIAAMIAADRTRLDYEVTDEEKSMVKPNADYGASIDASTLCPKRLLYQGTFDAIQHRLPNTALTPGDLIALVNMMREMGYETPCGICYVESRRRTLGQEAQKWLDSYEGEYKPKIEDVTTSDGLEKLRNEHPQAYEDFQEAMKKLNQRNPKVVQLRTNYRGEIRAMSDAAVQKAKNHGGLRVQSYSDFETPHLLDMIQVVDDMAIKDLTSQAYAKVPDFAWAFGDTGMKINLSEIAKNLGFTIDGDYTFKDIAAMPYEAASKLIHLLYDDIEGMKHDEAIALRNRYSEDVGTIIVGKSDAHIIIAMGDSEIDFIIPFHRSGWTKNERNLMETLRGYQDYTNDQNERKIIGRKANGKGYKTAPAAKSKIKNFEPVGEKTANGKGQNGYWDFSKSGRENAEVYLQMCKEDGRIPKFSRFLVDNGDGSFSLPQGDDFRSTAIRNGYWKTLIDFKMYNNDGVGAPQRSVTPNVNMEEAQRILNDYSLDRNGVTRANNNELPVAQPVVDRFVEEYKAKYPRVKYNLPVAEVDQRYSEAVQSGDTQTAQQMVEEAAQDAGYTTPKLYHGTPAFGFTEFDLDRGEQLIFATSDRRVAETYSGQTGRSKISDRVNAENLHGEQLLQAAKDNRAISGDYRIVTPEERERIVSEARSDILNYANRVADFVKENADAFNEQKMEIVERLENSIRALSEVKTEPEVNDKWMDVWGAATDLEYYDVSIYDELNSAVGLTVIRYNMEDLDTALSEGDLFAEEEDYITTYIPEEKLQQKVKKASGKGIYEMYGKPGNQLVIDAQGGNWNRITAPEELGLQGPQRTRSVADAAYKHGYDSVLLRNLRDVGGKTGYYGAGDIYIFFDKNQVKSADTVTYDDQGNVIPLSERFDLAQNDIRYSLPSDDTLEQMIQSYLSNGGMLSENSIPFGNNKPATTNNIIPPPNMPGPVNNNGPERGQRQRQFGSQTAQESDALHEEVKQYLRENSAYTPDTNQEQINRAISWVQEHATENDREGYFASIDEILSPDFNSMSADGQARILTVMSMAALKDDVANETRIADFYNRQRTEIARALQAGQIFRMMTPLGRQSVLVNEQNKINQRYIADGKTTRVKLSQDVLDAAGKARTEADFEAVRRRAWRELNEQMPVTWKERLQGWRMLSMLGNPRTHIRNIVGNAVFMPAVKLKNVIGTALERSLGADEMKTKSLTTSKENRQFARQDANTMQDVLRGEQKYNPSEGYQQDRKIFGTKNGLISKTVGKALQGLSDFNSWALEGEDWMFLRKHYTNALAGWMQANNLTPADMQKNPSLLQQARTYAISEAQKATYRDANETASTLSKLSQKGGVVGFIVDAALPFKKTPANILKRGIEYSPVGLLQSLATGRKRVAQYQAWVNGELESKPKTALSPTQYLDKVAAGMSGTAIAALGALLAAMGAVRVSLDDDDEFDKLAGEQKYSLKLELFGQDVSYTIDWAAPVCMPFFVGASIYDTYTDVKNGGEIDAGKIADSLLNITEPVFNLSMLDGVNSLLEVNKWSNGNAITQIGEKLATNYMSSFVPTVLGQVSRTIDPTRRQNYVESGASMSTWKYALEQVQNKTPFSVENIPYRDPWGEVETTPTLLAAFENFLSPGYVSTVEQSPREQELQRLFEATGNKSMVPSAANKTITAGGETIKLNDKQYDQYSERRGKLAASILDKLFADPSYIMMDDAAKAKTVEDAWTYANQIARNPIAPNAKIDKWVASAQQNGDPVGAILERREAAAKEEYKTGYKTALIKGIDDNDLESVSVSMAALTSAGMDMSDVKQYVTNHYKPLYLELYNSGKLDEAYELQIQLMACGLGYKASTIKDWTKEKKSKKTSSTPAPTTTQNDTGFDINDYLGRK